MKIDPPVKFPVNVKGKMLTAVADSQVKDPVKYILHIRFSDGYTDQFSLDSNGRVTGTAETSKPYAKAIRYDIVHIIGLNTKSFYHVFQYPVYGQLVNVWIIARPVISGMIRSILSEAENKCIRLSARIFEGIIFLTISDGKDINFCGVIEGYQESSVIYSTYNLAA